MVGSWQLQKCNITDFDLCEKGSLLVIQLEAYKINITTSQSHKKCIFHGIVRLPEFHGKWPENKVYCQAFRQPGAEQKKYQGDEKRQGKESFP